MFIVSDIKSNYYFSSGVHNGKQNCIFIKDSTKEFTLWMEEGDSEV